ncbi:MAG: hypothetical protein KC910_13485 [Candidatus Eremiobacteraeota bacterium]|nr:hypothetical protein [Candidatus Eremiobacteraeota bacterium]
MTRGHTLIEIMVSMGLLVLLLGVMFLIYRTGANAWKKSEAQVQLVQDAQVVTARLSREVERSIYASACLDPGPNNGTAVSFLSCWNEATASYDYDPASRSPVWQKDVICYYDGPSREVRWTEVPLTPATPTASPLVGLAGLRAGGRVLARDVTACDFVLSPRVLEMRLQMERQRYGSGAPERVEIPCRMFFRN